MKIILLNIDNLSKNFKWRYLSPKHKSPYVFKVHFLVVKDEKYIKVLKICIDSFLYWHPDSQVTIHVDSSTNKKAKKIFKKKRYSKNVSIVVDMNSTLTWQVLKLKLICSLNSSSDFYIDADMRWNGVMQRSNNVAFLTTEFSLKNKTTFLLLVSNLSNRKYINGKMRNTSFFTFGGHSISLSFISDLFILHEEIINLIRTELFGIDDKDQMLRISEQLALSLAVEDWGIEISHLKEIDKYKDGAFIESSYFGATGTSF